MKAWQNNIRKVSPYVPGEQPNLSNMIKLNTNENPYPPSANVQKAIDEFKRDKLRLYPSADNRELVEVLADYYHRDPSEVFVGVGSDDVLSVAFLTFFNSDKPILFPDITYSFYDVWAQLYRIPYIQPPLDDNFRIVREDYFQDNGGIVIANPNAPTSLYEGIDVIEDIVRANPNVIVIVDEAYIDFGGTSAMELIDKYDNLVIVQTFSKSRSMAGMRIGYAISNSELIKAMNDVKYSINSYTMNSTSLTYGVEAVKDEKYFRETISKITVTRDKTKEALKSLGFTVLDSKTNFLFVKHESIPAKVLFEALRQEGIFVRFFNKPRIDNYLRITIGTDIEMEKFLRFLKVLIDKSSFTK